MMIKGKYTNNDKNEMTKYKIKILAMRMIPDDKTSFNRYIPELRTQSAIQKNFF